LTNAIFAASGRGLEPITVWWSGRAWYLIDGHHRSEAYARANKSKVKGWVGKVPVQVFSGTLLEAVIEATRLNAKDKLPMQPEDKLNRAWLFVVMDEGMSRQKIATVCTVGTNTVSRMRRRLKELQELRELDPEDFPEDFSSWTWKEALEDSRAVKNYDDDWREKQSQEWARRLSRTFGDKLASQPEVFLKALEMHSPRFVSWLEEYLQDDPDSDF
jgi:ParB-like chromosome segregation protein Spo0J